ncbi:hypothetical protein J6E39_01450 [bacterium]|nr:hypothetical protein [bacterium]
MRLTDEQIKFDPGFIQHMTALIPTLENIYATLNKFKNFAMKRNQFKLYYPRLRKLVDMYTGFYLGCMLWAVALKREENKQIIGNLCYGGTFDDDTLFEVNCLIQYVEQLEKDAKYYLNENYKVQDFELDIMNKYKTFLTENEGFVKCQNTDDIKIPDVLKTPSDEEIDIIIEKVKNVVETGDFTQFYEIKDLIL